MKNTDINILSELHTKLLNTIQAFSIDKLDHIFYGDWTIKEVTGHISAWNSYFTQLFTSVSQGKPIDHWGSINQFNQKEVAKRHGHSLKQLAKELEETSQKLIDTYQKLDQNLLTQKIWPNRSYTPEKILKIQIHHYQSQIKEINSRS